MLCPCFKANFAVSGDIVLDFGVEWLNIQRGKAVSEICLPVVLTHSADIGHQSAHIGNAEFVAQVRKICDDAEVAWQTAELGKVDVGGGGTIAYICANYGMNVIDAGLPVLSMHAPWELISKVDLWQEYKCYCAFIKYAKEFEY